MKRQKSFVLTALILFMVLAGIAIVGCSQGGLTDQRTADGILVRLSIDKATYKLGEQINIVVYVKNRSSELFQYEYAIHKIDLSVWSEIGDNIGISAGGQKYTAEWTIGNMGTLDAGESITLDTFWDQKFVDDNAMEYNAVPGNYTIKANFAGLEYLRSIEGLPTDTDSVSVNITIEE